MATTSSHTNKGSIILHMHPLQRILLSLVMGLIVFLLIRNRQLDVLFIASIIWVTFSISFIITSWIIFFKLPVSEIVKKANREDGSRLFVLVSILVSSFASLFAVMFLMFSKDQLPGQEIIKALVAVLGMMMSWVLVHTIFTFHYAHLYYFEGADDTPGEAALDFPGKTTPDYIDFAYFSFVIGMTFQVSDVEINSHTIRRTVLAHSLLSFALNTFVVALTINLIAGLKN
jgi:uncharacterized membrane protein